MNLQFLHDRNIMSRRSGRGGVTYAVQVDHDILETCKIGDTLSTSVGAARCSEKDCFSKKTGRDLAISRLKCLNLRVTCVKKTLNLENDKISTRITVQSDTILVVFNRSSEDSKFRLVDADLV